MGLNEWFVKVSCFSKLALVFWWVELGLFSLERNEMFSSEFLHVYVFAVTLGCLYFNALGMFLHCWRISTACLALKLVGPWVVLGFSVDMEIFDELLSINVAWSQEFSGVLRIWT